MGVFNDSECLSKKIVVKTIRNKGLFIINVEINSLFP